MWRLTMLLFCMIAALSGTPLRQAEAASDFARSHGEFGPGDVIETIDGGTGDDKEASILKAGGDTHSLAATILLAMADVAFAPPISVSSLPSVDDRRRADWLDSLPANSARRHAWLQCFLI
jgi:hypothetical protein